METVYFALFIFGLWLAAVTVIAVTARHDLEDVLEVLEERDLL